MAGNSGPCSSSTSTSSLKRLEQEATAAGPAPAQVAGNHRPLPVATCFIAFATSDSLGIMAQGDLAIFAQET